MKIDLKLGDCLDVLKTLADNSVDSVITDPPYHLTSIVKRFGKEGSAPAQFGTDGAYARASKGFMGKEWDGGDIAFRTDVWNECLRVLKPGGHLIAFSHSRTYHRMAVAIEDAGFEIRDQIMWIYGSGFPKSLNIGKAIDKIEGNERQVIGLSKNTRDRNNHEYNSVGNFGSKELLNTKGNSEWEGWGTALKPAHEPMVLARKPLSEKSIAENVLKHGTGGLNIDGSRIEFVSDEDRNNTLNAKYTLDEDMKQSDMGFGTKKIGNVSKEEGRFPANIIFDEEAGKLLDEQSGISKSRNKYPELSKQNMPMNYWDGVKEKHIAGKEQTKDGYEDKGGASRFFYCPKASKKDRGENNNHPTVKPTDLMRYLINLITPPNGVVLDPFMGSGSTGKAAIRCGVSFIGIEREQEYMDIAKARINYEMSKQ